MKEVLILMTRNTPDYQQFPWAESKSLTCCDITFNIANHGEIDHCIRRWIDSVTETTQVCMNMLMSNIFFKFHNKMLVERDR